MIFVIFGRQDASLESFDTASDKQMSNFKLLHSKMHIKVLISFTSTAALSIAVFLAM